MSSIEETNVQETNVQETNKAIVVRYNKEFIEKGDMTVFEDTIAGDFVNRTPQQGQTSDRASVAYFFNEVLRRAFPDLVVTIHDQVAEGDLVVTRKSYTGSHRGTFLGVEATGTSVEFSVIDILKLRDGQYVEHWACADMLGLLGRIKA